MFFRELNEEDQILEVIVAHVCIEMIAVISTSWVGTGCFALILVKYIVLKNCFESSFLIDTSVFC